jgi:hypothetical protein
MPSRPLSHSGRETGDQPLAVERDFQCDVKLLFFLRYSIVCLIPVPHRYLRCRNETDATKTHEREAILAALAEAPRRGAAGAGSATAYRRFRGLQAAASRSIRPESRSTHSSTASM